MASAMEVRQSGQAINMWKETLCGCTEDWSSCCLGLWCPCILYGRNREATTGEGCTGGCCAFFWVQACIPCAIACITSSSRTTIRQIFKLPAQPCDDCCTYCFCIRCALCQESRELKARGAHKDNPALTSTQTTQTTRVITQAPQSAMMVPQEAKGIPSGQALHQVDSPRF